jgi:membrane-bound metal-dependent hydrolase YbcI (DUF457 family)
MFVGHFAVGLAAKKVVPGVSLGALFIACQLVDLIWPVLVLAGVEQVRVDHAATAYTPLDFEHYPWSHSLAMNVIWALAAFGVLKALRRTNREAVVVSAVVFSHWLLDLLTHRPDLPLLPGDSAKVGLGLWGSVAGTVIVETALFGAGVWLYLRATRTLNRKGTWALWTMLGLLALIYVGNSFGPKPPVDTPAAAIAGPALAMWLFVAWAHWADKNRQPTGSATEADAT